VVCSKIVSTPLRLLVVDDDPSVLLTYKLIFELQGYEVVAVFGAREAMPVLEKNHFDLLICDLSLETSEGGLEIIASARRRDPGVPAILLTGFATPELAAEAECRNIEVIYKPIEIRELLEHMEARITRSTLATRVAG